MPSKKFTAKRFFKSHIFRTVVFATALFATVFFPIVFAYPHVQSESSALFFVLIACACISETVIYLLLLHKLVYAPARAANDRLKALTTRSSGHTVSTTSVSAENTVDELYDTIKNVEDEFARRENGRKTFVANASHELRTPLTSIQGFLQAMVDGAATSEADRDKYLKIALGETKRLNALINSMLDLSRLDSGKNPIIKTKFDINAVIREIADRFEPELTSKEQQLNFDCSRDVCYVYADKEKIIQVITNLIDNAIKYSPAYSRIIVSSDIRENKAFITVRDFGYGIGKKEQMLIWDTFYMSDKSRSPVKTKGSGLGLPIVKKIIDEHGESIWVESSRGAGATFIFTLTLFDPTEHKLLGRILNHDDNNQKTDVNK